MKKTALLYAMRHGPAIFPGALAFIKRWWWALLLAALILGGLALWLIISLLVWAWHVLPEILGYFINHFAPAFEGLETVPAAPPPAMPPAPGTLESL